VILGRMRLAWRRWRYDETFIRAAHYFGGGWPVNCWSDMSLQAARRDFRAMRADGFNAVILVIPWRGFQVEQFPPRYDRRYLRLMRQVMREAARARLLVILRVSYAHHICDEAPLNSMQLTERLLTDPDFLAPWLHYLRRVRGSTRLADNYYGAFLSWEEFWHVLMSFCDTSRERRLELAVTSGYAQFTGNGDARIPARDEPLFADYHAFVNQRMRQLYLAAREIMPELSFEVRVDKDPVYSEDGALAWLENDDFAETRHPRYSYWAPFIGAENVGEELTSAQALNLLERSLRETTRDGENTAQIIDQFNFVDDTFKYAGQHARIAASELPAFVDGAAPLLLRYSDGMGIWAWRDYTHNCLFNPAFRLGLRGWTVEPGSKGRVRLGSRGLRLPEGSLLGQSFWGMGHGLHPKYKTEYIELELQCTGDAALSACLDGEHFVELAPDSDGRMHRAQLPIDDEVYRTRGALFRLRVDTGQVQVHRVSLSQHSFRVGIRDREGAPGPLLPLVHGLNRALSNVGPVL